MKNIYLLTSIQSEILTIFLRQNFDTVLDAFESGSIWLQNKTFVLKNVQKKL